MLPELGIEGFPARIRRGRGIAGGKAGPEFHELHGKRIVHSRKVFHGYRIGQLRRPGHLVDIEPDTDYAGIHVPSRDLVLDKYSAYLPFSDPDVVRPLDTRTDSPGAEIVPERKRGYLRYNDCLRGFQNIGGVRPEPVQYTESKVLPGGGEPAVLPLSTAPGLFPRGND